MKKLMLASAMFALAASCASAPAGGDADYVLTGGKIYTANGNRAFVEAIAVKGDEIVFAGSADKAAKFAGAETKTVDLQGRLVLPGLHDAHLHPVGAMQVDTCSINKQPMTLEELSFFVARCIDRFSPAPGEWLYIDLWEFERGNQPGKKFKTIRAALDAAAPKNPVLLEGTDGHHFAVNSLALATAKNSGGKVTGLSAKTLKADFADLAQYVGVDAGGEPNGKLTESYIYDRLDVEAMERAELNKRLASRDRMMEVTLPRGITSFMDAAARPETLPIYDELLKRGEFHARATLALYFNPSKFTKPDGTFDAEALLAQASALREKYAGSPLIKADYLKLFADGVMEGDPLSTPPTLPNAALSRDYLQPIFAQDENGVRVTGYVDRDSPACVNARTAAEKGEPADPAAFIKGYGFHPAQCETNAGVLQNPEDVIRDYVNLGDKMGFTFHIHAIGDRAVKTALDAIENAQSDHGSKTRHIVTHLQLVRPEDIARFKKLGAYASLTFAWAIVDPEYDLSVLPFIDRVDGPNGIYNPESYYMRNVYPAESIRKAGGVIIAGSDAPVDTRDPRPFVNIEGAVARDIYGAGQMNAAEALSIYDAVDAYTINAARALKQDAVAGSIERGKKADFIILNQDIFALAGSGDASAISDTKVLETWFAGEKVYSAPAN
ncbi:MAG: amidohydrolase family protein [Pseudomonadota bacterium]